MSTFFVDGETISLSKLTGDVANAAPLPGLKHRLGLSPGASWENVPVLLRQCDADSDLSPHK